MTHAKSRMYEFNVPEDLHVDIRGNDPSHLFPLVIGILGEEAGRIGDIDVAAKASTPRIIPEDAFALRFAAAFLHAYVTSRFGVELAPELLVLSAAAYYLRDLARAIELVIRSAFFAERADLAVVVAPFRALCSEITAFLRNAFRGDDVVLNELSDAMLWITPHSSMIYWKTMTRDWDSNSPLDGK